MNAGFSHNGKTLLSGVDPAGKADKIAGAVSPAGRTLYLCPSPLFGYGLECLLNRIASASNAALLCIEADPALYALSRENFPASLLGNSRLRLTNICDAALLCSFIKREWGSRFFRRVEIVRLSGGWQLFPALYETLAESIRREIALDWGNAMTLTKLGRLYIRNALRNLPLIPRCSSPEALFFGSVPVLVLGAGPSLDKALDSLAARFGRAVQTPENRPFKLICVDTCLSALHERGITPDLAVILESQHWNLADFTGLCGQKIPVAMDLSALPRSGNILDAGVSLFFTPWTRLAIFDRLDAAGLLPLQFPPLGSVGLSAVSMARRLTAGTVIVCGMDFSFSLDSYHARSTPGHQKKLRSSSRFTSLLNAASAFGGSVFPVAPETGRCFFSTPALRQYRDLFEREFAGEDAPAVFAIEGGGFPLGVKTISMEETFSILSGAKGVSCNAIGGAANAAVSKPDLAARLRNFICGEIDRLTRMKDMLTGSAPMDHAALAVLVDECDYLWAHFPDYAASDRRPGKAELEDGSDSAISFLKRLRVEIDPFLKILRLTAGDALACSR